MNKMSMSLTELAARLNEIIARNEAAGWADRNALPVAIEIAPPARLPRQHRKNSKHYMVDYASSSMHGVTATNGDKLNLMVIATSEASRIN